MNEESNEEEMMQYPELESTSSHDEDDILSNDHSENDVERDFLNSTYVGDEEGIMEALSTSISSSNDEEDFASAMRLQRNLTETFEKHAKDEEDAHSKASKSSKVGSVKDKIRAFETKKVIIKNKVRFDNSNNNKSSSISISTTSNNSRPPPVPVSIKSHANDKNKSSISNSSLLSTYLRIRPPSASKEAASQNESAPFNTVEILPYSNNNMNKTDINKNHENQSTTIRTYPPLQSNASKVVRGQKRLHSVSHNTDLIFTGSNRNIADSAVKGVKEFNFNQVFGPESSQQEVYDDIAAPLVEGLFPKDELTMVGDKLVGQSALLFSYGITNAGKTFTIMGNGGRLKRDCVGLDDSHGVIPRTIDHMLSKISEMSNEKVTYQLNMSYLEIYNEKLHDLLPKEKASGPKSSTYLHNSLAPDLNSSLRIREGKTGRVYVRGLTKHHVKSFTHGIQLTTMAKSRRHTSSNNINNDSSRSHSICQFELLATPAELKNLNDCESASVCSIASSGYCTDDDSVTLTKYAKKRSVTFWIVDLAGSERSKRTGAYSRSTRQKEAALINSSLMKLMRCLQTLRYNQTTSHSSVVIPFRESKLTHLFMDHLTGAAASRTSMVVNINPSVADFDETQHVLSYATVAKSIQITESDYNRKRRVIQMTGVSHTHSEDGRPIKNSQKASPPRKLARIVKKLSPRGALAKIREQKQNNNNLKRKAELQSLRGAVESKNGNMIRRDNKKTKFSGKRRIAEEIKELREALVTARAETEKYQFGADDLRKQLATCESEIRKEIYEETEVHILSICDQHNEIVNRYKQQLDAASQTQSKSVRKAQRDKADAMIEELMDKVDECEEEMSRMIETHKEDISDLKDSLSLQLAEKQKELAALKSKYEDTVEKNTFTIDELKIELSNRDKLIQELKDDRDSNLEDSHSYDDSSEGDEYSSSAADSNMSSVYEKENNLTTQHCDPSPHLRRLPRMRCSEVACADISPPKKMHLSSSKKQQKNKRIVRSPFKSKNARINESENDFIKSNSKSKEKVDVAGDLIQPSSQPEYDELTGLYHRPRGRAPNGRIWDSRLGGWKVSRAGMR